MLVIDKRKVRHLMVDANISGWTQLGAKCNPPIHPNTLYAALEKYRVFMSDTADRVAGALGVSPFEILSIVPDELKGQPQE